MISILVVEVASAWASRPMAVDSLHIREASASVGRRMVGEVEEAAYRTVRNLEVRRILEAVEEEARRNQKVLGHPCLPYLAMQVGEEEEA